MRKTLIALAVLGISAGVAHAQSSVAIYGIVDTGYVKETGRDLRMGSNVDNRIGFRGSEDLGGGLKATFELERRFDLNDGQNGNSGVPRYEGPGAGAFSPDWDGSANVGLAGDWGRVRFGRIDELTTETIRSFDPFGQYGVGSMIYSTQRSESIDNTVRYDSPNWGGFSFGLSYSLGSNTKNDNWDDTLQGQDNDGWGINLSYDNGPLALTGNFSRLADSDKSRVWNLAAAYRFGDARVSLLYENTRDKGWKLAKSSDSLAEQGGLFPGPVNAESKQQVWLLGLEWGIGPGELDASVQYFRLKPYEGGEPQADTRSNWKYALGYTYNLSRRTAAYAQTSYTRYNKGDDYFTGEWYHGLKRGSVTAFQLGVTHRF